MAATQAPFSALLPQPLSLKDSRRAAPPFLSRPFLSCPSKLASPSISATPCIYRQRFQRAPISSLSVHGAAFVFNFSGGLSFRTTEESLRNAFKDFGQLVEVKLVMDRIANRPRGFAFLRYATEEESKKVIEEMHGKGYFCRTCETKIGTATEASSNTILRSINNLDGLQGSLLTGKGEMVAADVAFLLLLRLSGMELLNINNYH